MNIVTITGVVAASITVASTTYFIYKKIKKALKSLEERLINIEDNFKIREELILKEEIIVKNEINSKIYTLNKDTSVFVYSFDDSGVEFVTSDRLIRAKASSKYFKQKQIGER